MNDRVAAKLKIINWGLVVVAKTWQSGEIRNHFYYRSPLTGRRSSLKVFTHKYDKRRKWHFDWGKRIERILPKVDFRRNIHSLNIFGFFDSGICRANLHGTDLPFYPLRSADLPHSWCQSQLFKFISTLTTLMSRVCNAAFFWQRTS